MNTFVKTLITSSFLLSLTACSTVSDIFLKPAPNFLSKEEGFEQINKAQICCNGDLFNTKKIVNVVKDSDENYNFDLESADASPLLVINLFFQVKRRFLHAEYGGTCQQVVFLPPYIAHQAVEGRVPVLQGYS